MLRALVLLLGLLLVSLYPVPAAAIVITCSDRFDNCDPYSGTCYTAWTAALAGMVQANCSANPAACWLQSITAPPTCDDPIPPPVNPAAIRMCPLNAACADSPLTSIPGYPIALGQLPGHVFGTTAQDVFECHAMDFNVFPPVDLGPLPSALTCLAIQHYPNECPFAPHGMFCAPPYNVSFSVGKFTSDVYEPAPTCGWDIRPTLPVDPCELPVSAMLGIMKDTSPARLTKLRALRERVNNRIDVKGWALSNGLYGASGTAKYMSQLARHVWLFDLAATLAHLIEDPPSNNYQFLPGPGAVATLTPLSPDGTLSQTQINAIQAWLAKVRDLVSTGRQLAATMDNLGGALLAAEAGTPGAATWVHNLAVHADTVQALLASQGLAEIAARTAVVTAGPSMSEPAACSTPTAAANLLKQTVIHGSTLYQGHLLYQDHVDSCGVAVSDPGWLATDAAEDTATWNALPTLNIAAYLCTANPAYCAGPVATITPGTLAFGTWPLGALSPLDIFTVQNVGATPLVIGSASLVGADATQFVRTNPKDFCSGQTLAPTATCTIGVKFQPTTVGPKTATLQVPSNAPTVSATVTGTGSGNVGVSPASIAFGALPVGTLSGIRFATVTNTGTVTMTMGAIGISGASANQFIKTNPKDLCSGKTLIPGATCTLGIKFLPTSLGAKTAILNIAASTGAVSVILTGTGI